MAPYRTPAVPNDRSGTHPTPSAAAALPWLLIGLGGARVAQAFARGESWGAEATLFLGMLIFGLLELTRAFVADSRDR